jgi:glutathionyl-hydroquinone reductase
MTQTKTQHTETLAAIRYSGRLVAPRSYMVDSPPRFFMADPGRFVLYAAWSSPWAQRGTLTIALAGLTDVVRVFYVDTDYGRKRLRKAYQASDPYSTAAIALPTLWDAETGYVVSNDHSTIDIDLATELRDWSTTGLELYPADLREEIDELDRWIGPAVNHGVFRAIGAGAAAGRARVILDDALGRLDRRLGGSRYLTGDRLTLADVRLWVTLVRLAPPSDARKRIGHQLSQYRSLWAYAQGLYERDAFQRTTDPTRFANTVSSVGSSLSVADSFLAWSK